MADSLPDDDTGYVEYDYPYAQIPEWVLFSDVLSDRAVRLYGVILRFGNTSGRRIPGRKRLASLCGGCSLATLDRAKTELVEMGAIEIKRRFEPGSVLSNAERTNLYVVHRAPWGRRVGESTNGVSSVTGEEGVDAWVSHNRECFTDRPREPETQSVDKSKRFFPGVGWIEGF
jgi:hypothetical protein